MDKKRPIGVTILAILAGIGALLAIVHTLQMLHLFPILAGPFKFFTFDLLGAILWGILAAIYIWLVRMLWNINPQAWLFMVILGFLNIILALISIIGSTQFGDVAATILLNSIILIYCLMPGTREAFGIEQV